MASTHFLSTEQMRAYRAQARAIVHLRRGELVACAVPLIDARVPLTCLANVSASMSGCSFGCCGAAVTVVVVGEGPNVTADDANGDTS